MDARSLNSGYYFRLLLPLLFLQKASGCQKYACSAVGIDDSSIIPDSSFTANSELNGYEAKKARFSSDRCWEPNGNGGVDDYLQIDLGKVFFICAVATKGNAKPNTPEWTTEYKISTSSDGTVWITYPEDNNSPKLFPGNTDWNIAVKNDLDIPVMAKLIRFTPTQYRKFKALRVEVFGIGAEVYQDPCSAVGVDYGNIIPNSSFTANSELRDDYAASKARFSSDYCWEPNGNGGVDHYLQIDLGKAFVICAVATKGNAKSSASEWTTEYKISTSSDGNLWIIYSDNNNSPKLFPGNTDTNTAVKNDLVTPVLAKLIRFTPTQYHNYKALRVEVYGIDSKDFSCKSLPVGVASVAKIPDNSMTSSSRYNISTPPSNGRLGYTAGSSWCAATSDQYLQVKMSSPYIICGVATQGDHKSDQWVQTYQIQTSTDGSSFTDYMHNNVIEDFAGNTDSNTIVKNMLYEGTVSQYIRINAKSDYGTTSCMRTELYGVQQNTVCSKMSIGVPYSSLIPDHRFSASSYIHNAYLPSYARLKNTKAWEPKTKNVGDWLHIDLGSVVYVCAVATQGNAYSSNEYAKKYKLKISLDNVNWRYYQENNADKTFTGNTDKTTIVTNTLAVPTKTKFLRFYPTVFNGYAAMRVDVYGVPATCSSPFGVEKGGSVKGDSKMTSSSESDSSHAASFGRLYGDASWCSNTSSNTEYIQIDLGKMVTLTGIATQGNHTMNKWVKNYTLKYSIDGSVWNDYRGNQSSAKVFQGNSDRTSIVVRWFSHPVTVRYVRVYPQSWNTAICMRIELFGCQCPSPPEIKELSNKILTAESSKNVDLECNVQEPLIKNIDWYSGGKDVTSHSGGITRTANFVKSVLRVNFTSANDVVNTYQCTNVACRKNFVCRAKYAKADSNADSIKGAEVLVNLEFPSAPSLSPVGSIHSRSVVVRWTQPSLKVSQASIQTYVIKYWNSGTTKTISVSHTATSHTLSSLSVCTSYNVTIKAVSKLGEGPWSNTKTFKTDSEVPTAAPGSVEAQAKTSQSILVKWQVPSNVRCAPSGYKVIYSKTSGRSHEATVNGGQSISYTLTGLDKWTEYSINVKVRNDKGYGSSSSPVVKLKTLEDEPDAAPESFKGKATSCTSISLSWDLPTSNKRNGNIKGYRLWYCKTGHCSSPLAVKTYTGTSTVLRNLDMYTQYTLKVLAYTSVGDGPYTNNITIRTHEGPPSPPTKVKTTVIDPVDSTGPKVKIEWEKPSFSYGEIKGYKVSYGKKEDENTKLFDNQTLSFEFDVCGGLSYITKVWAFHSKEGAKTVETVPINDYVPVQPTKPKVVEYNTTTFHVSFQPLPSTNGHIIIYELEINSTLINKMVNVSCGEVPCRGLANQTCSYTLHDLGQCTKYNIKVRAYTTKGAGPYSETVELKTSTPGSPRNLKVVMDQNTAKLEWLPPQPLAKPVQQYTISYYGRKTYDFSWDGFPSPNHTTRSTSLTTTVTDLYPATSYRFTVKAMTECGEGDYSNKVQGDTEVGEPPAPKRGNVSTITSAVGNITLWKISDINGKLDLFLVYIHEVKDKKRKKRSSDSFKLTCKEIAKDAAELRPHTETFPLGDGKKYGNYENVKLKEGKQFEVFQCGKTKNLYGPMGKIAVVKVPVSKDNTLSQTSTPNTTLVASLVTVFLLLIIGACAAVLFVIWRRRGRRENERSDNMKFQNIAEMEEPNGNATSRDVPTHNNDGFVSNGTPFPDDDDGADLYGNAETIRHQPIPANKFNQYVNEKNEALKGEFKLLSNGQLFPCDVAKDPKNKPKNRYANIITYNHSRVVLQDTADGSDYINASYIHGFDGTPRTYIATQGPNPLTVPDIWHMIWQENITTIVILTNLIEGGKVKCHQYWPDHKEQYGPFTVNLHRSDILADYVVRIFIISKDGEIGNRQVYHYQYTSWPDKGVPQHATSVLGFRRKVKSQYMSSGATAPLLVHCSAGVGRTGAFLAIDAMMEKVKKEKSVDIFNYVQLMRNNRSTMIQTDEQYLFVHLALQEAITCGNTEIPVLNLNIALTRLSKERPRDRQTGYELEWRRLAAISPKVTVENSKAGRLEQNIPRNRYTDTFPFDSGRVFLSQEQQNYINASFGDAYRERNAFIMAQAPMENTMTDFWHMIHQYKIGSIVMLNKLTEDQETFPQYWPVQGSDMYEGIIVEVVSSSTRGPLFITQCVVTHPWEPKSPHNVLHIQHTDWPESGVPSDSQSVLEIVDKVQKSQQQSGNAPIAVHCSDGVGRSGTFCAVYSLLERVKSEQVMDVFQAIKVLRLGRPNAVSTLDQYKFCYRMVQIYLDSFNDYANFSEV